MPELPDVSIYVEALERRVVGRTLERVRIGGPSLLRSVDPPISEVEGHQVRSVTRLGKRIVVGLEDQLFLVSHLMIAGRFLWKPKEAKIPHRIGLAAFDFSDGTLLLTEAYYRQEKTISAELIYNCDQIEISE